MSERLAIWLYETKVAIVDRERRRMRLRYTPEALEAFPDGAPLLSLQLPLNDERFPNGVVRPFLDGLLPEGDARRVIAEDLGLRADDTFGLAMALGRDCAGALVIQPDGSDAPRAPTTLTAEPLSDDDLGRLVDNLRSAPLGVNQRVRISLAGVQEKLLLTRLPDGTWGRPVDGTPSTHILKPEIREYPHTVENEAFCMRVARHLGMTVADIETITVNDRRLIAVSRYDRAVGPSGAVERIHQEDFCQATGLLPSKKYEEDSGPSLRKMAGILRTVNRNSLETLLEATTLNVILGNGDAHAKNFSLLHDRRGALRLAPLYDLLSTLMYGDDRLAMYIDNVHRTNRVTFERLINEATTWGLSRTRAEEVATTLLARVPDAVKRAASETLEAPAEVLEIVRTQMDMLKPSDAQILAHTSPDPELEGLSEHIAKAAQPPRGYW
jgi:serine/threonine-protein kinase HipA